MSSNKYLENQLIIIDTIVKSLSPIIEVLCESNSFNGTIKTTFDGILKFLLRILKQLPEILISGNNTMGMKSELILSFSNLTSEFSKPKIDKDLIIPAWFEFEFWWDEFFKNAQQIEADNNTIIISMN
jgi:hypothetical protein